MGTRNLPRHVASRPRSARSLGLLSGSSNYRGETSDRQIVEGRRKGGRKRKGGRERKADDFFVVGSGGAGLRNGDDDDVAGGSEHAAPREQVS